MTCDPWNIGCMISEATNGEISETVAWCFVGAAVLFILSAFVSKTTPTMIIMPKGGETVGY